MLPQNGEHMKAARVLGRVKNNDGKYIGKYDKNPILDTRMFNVEFPDGSISEYDANTVRENIYSRVDEEGHRFQLLDRISNHRNDNTAIKCGYKWIVAKNGRRSRKHTTKGWYLEVQWRDGTTS